LALLTDIQGVASNAEIFRAVWDAYTEGRWADMPKYLDPEVQWRPALTPELYQGLDDLRHWVKAVRREWKSMTIVFEDMREVADDCVVAFGRLTAFDYGGEQGFDDDMAWVAEFRDGRIIRATSFKDRDEALAYVTARREEI